MIIYVICHWQCRRAAVWQASSSSSSSSSKYCHFNKEKKNITQKIVRFPFSTWDFLHWIETHTGLPQTPKIESFVSIINRYKLWTIVAKLSIADICEVSGWASGLFSYLRFFPLIYVHTVLLWKLTLQYNKQTAAQKSKVLLYKFI